MPGTPLVNPASITMRTPWPIDSVTDAVTISAIDAPTTYQRYGARYCSAAFRLPSLRLGARSSMRSNMNNRREVDAHYGTLDARAVA